MGLAERLRHAATEAVPAAAAPTPALTTVTAEAYHELKAALHQRLVDKVDLRTLEKLAPERLTAELRAFFADAVSGTDMPLNRAERDRMIEELLDEVTGLGPLEPLLRDGAICDILVNTFATVYVERFGKLERTPVRFRDNDHLMQIINRIVARVGRRVDETSPMVDARLPDGSRVNAIIPPLAVDGPILSIRRFGTTPLRIADLLGIGSLTPEMVGFLGACVAAKLNILISGGTGTGKTTMLNALSSFIPHTERIVTIEDSAELQLQQPHVVRLETRPPNVEGKGEILARDLVRNALRMRPDRIIVGEVRAAEVLDMLQAMNTGHEGSMATVHANSPRDALARLEAMIGLSGVPMPEGLAGRTISRALHLLIQLSRGSDGKRRMTSISEISGTEGAVITLQELFRFDQRGVDAEGRVIGAFTATGIRPKLMEQIERSGVDPVAIARQHVVGA